jgi:hypothetical protein
MKVILVTPRVHYIRYLRFITIPGPILLVNYYYYPWADTTGELLLLRFPPLTKLTTYITFSHSIFNYVVMNILVFLINTKPTLLTVNLMTHAYT